MSIFTMDVAILHGSAEILQFLCKLVLRFTKFQTTLSLLGINVTDGMFCMNRTTSVPKSALRYTFVDVDGVDLSSDLQG